jgi:hypothetical protein
MSTYQHSSVANPGSTLGEAIGALIEREVNRLLLPIAQEKGCVYVTAGRPNPRTGRSTLLKLKDAAGNEYRVDSVIANERMQPLVLIESKYIRYKKHNRDKGSWICMAHYSLRKTYPTIRKSIAVLAGNWSSSSKAMMESYDVGLFDIGFRIIVETLAQYGVDITWEEKDRNKAMSAWLRWEKLSEKEYSEIARILLAGIEPYLRRSLDATLDTTQPREVKEVEVTIETNLGESRQYNFDSIAAAIAFLENFNEQEIINDEKGASIWEIESSTGHDNPTDEG